MVMETAVLCGFRGQRDPHSPSAIGISAGKVLDQAEGSRSAPVAF